MKFFSDIVSASKEIAAFQPVDRSSRPEQAKDAYEDLWGKRVAGIREKLKRGESLSHILHALRPPPHQLGNGNRVAARIIREMCDRAGVAPDETPSPYRVVATAAGYQLATNFNPWHELLLAARDAKNIVELGSGPGWNLFELAVLLGKAAANKRFFALEYTDAGLDVSRLLAEHPESPSVSGHLFDYMSPDLSMIPDDGPTLFFSQHSIEQVEDISDELYSSIIGRHTPATIIHIEPIGWQRQVSITRARMVGNDAFFQALVARRGDADAADAVIINAAINSWRQGYNRNALHLLMKHVSQKRLSLKRAVYDFTWDRNTNIVNPSTYIRVTVRPPAGERLLSQ